MGKLVIMKLNRNTINRNQKSQAVSLPAPVNGWNSKNSLAQMMPTEAIKIINFFPSTSEIILRKGYIEHSVNLSINGQINSLMAYNGINKKLFACSNQNIYDVTARSTTPLLSLSGISSDKFIYTNITTPGGTFLIVVNGVDELKMYNGTTWSTINATSTPAITGANTAEFSYVTLAKNRLWFVQKNTTIAQYLPVKSIGGGLLQLDLGAVFLRGGKLKAISSWAITGGFGVKDLTVFMSTEGDIAVYEGNNPSDANDWFLVGVYNSGTPIGNMPFSKMGTDLLVLTQEGLMSLAQGQFFADISEGKTSITEKIQPSINIATSEYKQNHGWQCISYPNENMLILNVPIAVGKQEQYVMNTITNSWCQFQNIKANCFCLFNDRLYFGSENGVYLFWEGHQDNRAQINGECLTSFSYFNQNNLLKHFQMVRPVITTGERTQFNVGLELDFKIQGVLSSPNGESFLVSKWDEAIWDDALWSWQGEGLSAYWVNVQGLAYTAALHIKAVSKANFNWASTDFMYTVGGLF
jgi:hypothetical protein